MLFGLGNEARQAGLDELAEHPRTDHQPVLHPNVVGDEIDIGEIAHRLKEAPVELTVMAAGIALLLVKYLLPRFNTLIGTDLQINYAENVSLLLLILGTTILEGLASGSYPAFVLSAFHPSHILKDQTASGKRGVKLRNALVVVQFSASIVLIISTIIIYA